MGNALRIRLSNIDLDTLKPGDKIACTVNGLMHFATYTGPASFRFCIWVEIIGLLEVKNYKLRQDMFASFRDEFVINDDGTACNSYEEG